MLSYWPNWMRHGWTAFEARQLVSALVGVEVPNRSGPIHTEADPDGVSTVFPEAEDAKGWLDRVRSQVEADNLTPFTSACFSYAVVALNHPFPDGNGRLARAFFHGALGRSLGLTCPFIPLGPICYLHHRRLGAGLRSLSATGDWEPFVGMMADFTSEALALL